MKKYIVLCLLLVAPFFAKADTTVYGFLDNKFYDVSQKLVYFCFQDGSCFDMNNNPVQITINHPADIVASSTPVVIPLDVCANIEGTQTVIPVGMVNQGGNCVVPVVASQPIAGGATPVQSPSVVAPVVQQPTARLNIFTTIYDPVSHQVVGGYDPLWGKTIPGNTARKGVDLVTLGAKTFDSNGVQVDNPINVATNDPDLPTTFTIKANQSFYLGKHDGNPQSGCAMDNHDCSPISTGTFTFTFTQPDLNVSSSTQITIQ